jgi:hypothetical protein
LRSLRWNTSCQHTHTRSDEWPSVMFATEDQTRAQRSGVQPSELTANNGGVGRTAFVHHGHFATTKSTLFLSSFGIISNRKFPGIGMAQIPIQKTFQGLLSLQERKQAWILCTRLHSLAGSLYQSIKRICLAKLKLRTSRFSRWGGRPFSDAFCGNLSSSDSFYFFSFLTGELKRAVYPLIFLISSLFHLSSIPFPVTCKFKGPIWKIMGVRYYADKILQLHTSECCVYIMC